MLCVKANAKINWTLDIKGVRPDGYHLLDTLMHSVELCDTLTLEPAGELTLAGEAEPEAKGEAEPMASARVTFDESNLVLRAARALREYAGVRAGARMTLVKRIPSGAGLGGGSADAAAALRGLNALWNLGLSRAELLDIGLSLGADVPFMLTGGLGRVGGIGEEITSLCPAPELWLLLIQPCGGLSTKEVFRAWDAAPPPQCRPDADAAQAALLAGNVRALGRAMGNVLQPVCEAARPELTLALGALQRVGAVRAMMTGSGSVVYGVFESRLQAERAQPLLPYASILTRTLAGADEFSARAGHPGDSLL